MNTWLMRFGRTIGVATGTSGDVYVVDRVQKFTWTPTPTIRTTWGRIKQLYR